MLRLKHAEATSSEEDVFSILGGDATGDPGSEPAAGSTFRGNVGGALLPFEPEIPPSRMHVDGARGGVGPSLDVSHGANQAGANALRRGKPEGNGLFKQGWTPEERVLYNNLIHRRFGCI